MTEGPLIHRGLVRATVRPAATWPIARGECERERERKDPSMADKSPALPLAALQTAARSVIVTRYRHSLSAASRGLPGTIEATGYDGMRCAAGASSGAT
jgi:hypothetical protein